MEKKEKKRLYCAIYTRKSTSEGLNQDFTTLDAQREAAENYIASQKSEGWVPLRLLPYHEQLLCHKACEVSHCNRSVTNPTNNRRMLWRRGRASCKLKRAPR